MYIITQSTLANVINLVSVKTPNAVHAANISTPPSLSLSLSLSRNLHNHAPNHLNLYAGLPLLRFPRQDASGRSLQPLFGYRERGSLCVLDVADIEGVCALLLGIIFLGRLCDFCATAAFRRLFFQEAVDCVELGFC
jgi:hypothetical protein